MNRGRHMRRSVPGGAQIFRRIFTRLGCQGRPPHFVVEFHRYSDLTLTIRISEEAAYVRFSDLLRGAPLPVMEAAAAILMARVYRKRVPRKMRETYRRFSYARLTRRLLNLRRARSRRVPILRDGERHDLRKLFDRLSRQYFNGRMERPALGWSWRPWKSMLGCFDPARRQIVINRALDRPDVPGYVVCYVLFHEMLHMRHPQRLTRCGLESHSVRFREEEKRFAQYERAMQFLKTFAAQDAPPRLSSKPAPPKKVKRTGLRPVLL